MKSFVEDTIVGISTKLGTSAISIIRLSGPKAIEYVNSCFKGKNLEEVPSHTIHYGYIMKDGNVLDEVLVTVMRAPKSFTTEDVVEVNCHGGIYVTLKIYELLQNLGARVAEPGEFTKRAFLNGRIDLTQAESVMDVINSKNDQQRKISISGLKGNLKQYIEDLRHNLQFLLANIEVNIDYPEYHDIEEITEEKLLETVKEYIPKMKNIIHLSQENLNLKNGIKTVIIGRPNVGKSSLLNALLQEDKAIVTSIEGTTRDIVEGEINIAGIDLNLIDTAGIRDTEDEIEKIGVEKSIELIDQAELVIAVFDSSQSLTDNDKEILDRLKNKDVIIVLNKNDLESVLKKSDFNFRNVVSCNTTTIEGLNELKEKIKSMYYNAELDEENTLLFSNVRQISLAKEALQSLESAKHGLDVALPIDLVSIDLQNAYEALGQITGESYDDELLDTLFANFCVGK